VAYYLYIKSKEVSDDEAGLYRAAALALIGKTVDSALLQEVAKRKSNDDPLHSDDIRVVSELEALWDEHHK
jgi:hypothetical protein